MLSMSARDEIPVNTKMVFNPQLLPNKMSVPSLKGQTVNKVLSKINVSLLEKHSRFNAKSYVLGQKSTEIHLHKSSKPSIESMGYTIESIWVMAFSY